MADREAMIVYIKGILHDHEDLAIARIRTDRLTDILALLKEQEPVVSCKDCKYWNAGVCLNDNVAWQIQHCGCYPNFVTDSDWFCAEGERR